MAVASKVACLYRFPVRVNSNDLSNRHARMGRVVSKRFRPAAHARAQTIATTVSIEPKRTQLFSYGVIWPRI